MVLYALITEVSVGKLFAAGVGPGLLLFVLVDGWSMVCHSLVTSFNVTA